MEPTPGLPSTEYDAALLALFNGPADVERFCRLFLLWRDVYDFVKNRPLLEVRKIRELTPERIEYAQTQAELIKRLREEYPGVKPAPMPRSKLAPEYQKMLRSAKQLMRMPRHALVHPDGPALAVQSLELHMKMRAQADELNGLVIALASRNDAPHQLALLKAMATVGIELEPE